MPNKAEKKDAIRPLSDDEETFTFDRPLLSFRSPSCQNLQRYRGYKSGRYNN